MKNKLKKILISFIVMIMFNMVFSSPFFWGMGLETPHVGLLYVLGLLFGPYGALGAVIGNAIHDLANGFTPIEILPSAIVSFGVSYLAYKLWYSGFKTDKVTKPNLNSFYNLNLFFFSILTCGFIYSAFHGNLIGIIFGYELGELETVSYFMNFINIAFIFGIISIWISKKFDFVETPKLSKRHANKKVYMILFCLLILVSIVSFIETLFYTSDNFLWLECALIGVLLFAYLTKPFEYEIESIEKNTIIEKIIRNFLIITLAIAIIGVIISIFSVNFIENIENMNLYVYLMPMLIISDILIILFFAPGMVILRYLEENVIKPISSFSEIEGFIKENEKIEAEGLVDIYSQYINEQNEIGTLARSYTYLINHNNSYIENIREIEGEKERIAAELDIARKIQAANLPTEALIEDDFIVNGYSHPAKEVGGDFFDYYKLDDGNLVIVIGDAAGKGVPAAILAMVTQVMIKQILQHESDPSKALYILNNLLCENNSETMFMTLWLGIYNKASKTLSFSNAGHNPPLIKENTDEREEFKYLDIDSGIVLGVMEDFEYIKEETAPLNGFVIYTDGITDANNSSEEMYGEDRLLSFFNDFKEDSDPIRPLLNDINNFTEGQEQFDDMTLVYLKDKK